MKRKLALLLAAVMTLSMLPMNVFAATSNSVTSGTTVIPKKSLLYETGSGITGGEIKGNDDIEYTVEGGELVLTTNDYVQEGDTFRLTLENAKWFFRNSSQQTAAASASALDVSSADNVKSIQEGDLSVVSNKGGFSASIGATTFDSRKGIWFADDSESKTGVYYRYADFGRGATQEVPYSLRVSNISDKEAVVTILGIEDDDVDTNEDIGYLKGAGTDPDQYYYVSSARRMQIRIPLVTVSTEDNADLRVKVSDSNVARITQNTTHTFGVAGSALTKTYVDDPQSARDALPLNMIVVKETRINSIGEGEFTISAPSGFYFAEGNEDDSNVEVKFEGLSATTKSIAFEDDDTILRVKLGGVTKSKSILGSVYIVGLTLFPDDDSSYWGDVNLTIKNVQSNNKIVTNETFKAGTRVDWTISLTTEGTIPELINGRYKEYDAAKATDEYHQTARVVFKENSVAAWWAQRQAVFTLPEGVKFRKVEVVDTSELQDNYDWIEDRTFTYTGGNSNGSGKTAGHSSSSVTVNGNEFTLSNFRVKSNKKAKIVMDVWVSIESGFKGDVTMTVTGSGIPAQGDTDKVPEIVIAKQITPVTVSTKITDIKIGYQLQPTADIVITETKAGNLLRDKTVNVSATDFASYASEINFSPDTKVAVTTGDLKIKNIRISKDSAASSSALSTTGGTLQFDIDRVSSKAATITLSNVSVKIDRTVPESNDRPYKVVVWGTAIAENYNNTSGAPNDTFGTPGIEADYLRVISSANDKSSLLSQRVEVAIGETTYTVNGETKEMDAAAYISPASNSTLVPVRFIANAFGIPDNQVKYSDDTKAVTVIHGDRIVQFTTNSPVMTINGTAITNYSPDGLPVSAENTGDRVYVPFRALGDAFGVVVDWDEATQTAIYNPDVKLPSDQ